MSSRNYQKLTATEKKIYSELKSSVKAFQLSVTFHGVSSNTISNALKALLDDNPAFFWLTGGAQYKWTERGGVIMDITCRLELVEGITPSALRVMSAKLRATLRDITARAGQYRTHFQRILFVHDYIVDTTDYVSNAPMRYNAYGCLVAHRAVCAGYAKAFQLIMEELGYECGYVRGSDRKENTIHSTHAWNYIKIENDYYFIDVTWDDPKVENANSSYDNKTRHYFCIPEQELSLTHRISKKYDYPVCKGTKYNYYLHKGYFLRTYSFPALKELALTQLRKGGSFTVKFASKQEADRALTELISHGKVYDIPGVSGQITYTTSNSGLIITIKN